LIHFYKRENIKMVESEKKKSGDQAKKDDIGLKGKKILVDTLPPRSGSCMFHNLFYAIFGVLAALYVAFSLDREAFHEYTEKFHLCCLHEFFSTVEKYSPFQEFLESDEDFIDRLKKENPSVQTAIKVFSKEELKKYDGSPDSPGLYLAILGKVYDVSKGKDYYGPGGGYAFFSARDGSRAFVTGQFDEEGLIEDTTGLPLQDYLGLKEWEEFYESDYTRVGVLEGAYYTATGDVTQAWKDLQKSISAASQDRESQDVEKQVFPPCNVEWSQDKGSRFWCTTKSGGIKRNWVGVPRRLFYPGRDERCACIRSTGPPSTDPGASSDKGDLENPHLKEYAGCAPDTYECWKQED